MMKITIKMIHEVPVPSIKVTARSGSMDKLMHVAVVSALVCTIDDALLQSAVEILSR